MNLPPLSKLSIVTSAKESDSDCEDERTNFTDSKEGVSSNALCLEIAICVIPGTNVSVGKEIHTSSMVFSCSILPSKYIPPRSAEIVTGSDEVLSCISTNRVLNEELMLIECSKPEM